MSDFHITAEIPPEATPEEAIKIRAEAFRMALMHAATDPEIQRKMREGEERSKMKMMPVQSSNLAAIGYDSERRVLRVQFKSGQSHDYQDVPPEEHSALMAADSHGKHYHARIKKVYDGQPVTDVPPLEDDPGADEAERYPRAPEAGSPRSLEEAIARFTGNG